MAEHYTRATVEVKGWCRRCVAFTMHAVQGGRKAACQACMKRLETTAKTARPQATQERLF